MKYFFLTFTFICLIGTNYLAHADTAINLSVDEPKVQIGELMVMKVLIDTSVSANAIEGILQFDATAFKVEKIDDGGSIISLWIKKPAVFEEGIIRFSGITPGGFEPGSYQILRISLRPLKTGSSTLTLPARILANDGLGTDLFAKTGILSIVVEDTELMILETPDTSETDTEPPEAFNVKVLRNDPLFLPDTVLIFQTTDKGSGMQKYLVREYRWPIFMFLAPWRQADGVYRIRDQNERSYIDIKAIDNAGNERTSYFVPKEPYKPWSLFLIVVILMIVIFWFAARKKHEKD